MVDDSAGDFWGATDGARGKGFANGWIVVTNSSFFAGPGSENYSPILRVANNGSQEKVARGVLVEGCNIWGQRTSLQFGNIPSGKLAVRGCNTPQLKEWATAQGINTQHESVIPLHDRLLPVSAGYTR